MKLLFFDIDGVLNSTTWYSQSYKAYIDGDIKEPYIDFDPNCVSRLNRVCGVTGCKLVLSSSWRLDAKTPNILKVIGIEHDLFGMTDFRTDRNRGLEIQDFLDKTPKIETYAIVDDDNIALKDQKSHFVKTNPFYGLTDDDMKKLIALF